MARRSATRLRFGPYKPPRYHRGDTLYCEVRGETTVAGTTAGRVSWPIGKFGRRRAIIVCGDLVRALRQEAACAVMRWWGVGQTTVNRWRRALGVPKLTAGDRLGRAEAGRSPGGKRALRAIVAARSHGISLPPTTGQLGQATECRNPQAYQRSLAENRPSPARR